MITPKRALLSVANKDGLAAFAKQLVRQGIEIYSTGGTAKALRAASIKVVDVSKLSKIDSALGGRVKTLHPAVLGSILFDRRKPAQKKELAKLGGLPIDIVVVNFYPFGQGVKQGRTADELVELIDIGGPTMVRSAAKNHQHVAVLTSPDDYDKVAEELAANDGALSLDLRRDLAARAFELTSAYDAEIAKNIAPSCALPVPPVSIGGRMLGYGENPHQEAALYRGKDVVQLNESSLSFNNVVDAVIASRTAFEHCGPVCAIIKHATPCAVASSEAISEAVEAAFAADRESAYGSVLALNTEPDEATLSMLLKKFIEVLICPRYPESMHAELVLHKRTRLLVGPLGVGQAVDMRYLGGIALVQQRDVAMVKRGQLENVSRRQASEDEVSQLLFAWKVVKHVKSNAIVLVKGGQTIGIGTGQTSRVFAVRQALQRARDNGFDPKGAVAASDAFFPFADGLEVLAGNGVTAAIQPRGSKRDMEVVASADEAGMALLHTGMRHFSH